MLADLGFRCRAIDKWPGEFTKHRERARFDSAWGPTVKLLSRELRHLGAKRGGVVMVAVDEYDIRNDGSAPKANARADHPGVILAFESRYGPLKYACDHFTTWQDNIRAIALGLEALRKVDRYGISRRGEQYTGYRALPAADGAGQMTPDLAYETLAKHSGMPAEAIKSHPAVVDMAWTAAVKRTHPDTGGDPADFRAVQQAKDVLRSNGATQ